ncbi:MAG: NAD(P)H-dependent oxidoreductase [Lewinellaceae bacterium]|nr:NAD(P)H-dependent oxidoreductase [Lewinellaceae bacterium]
MIESYLRAILGFLGITDITVFRVEGVTIPGTQETAMEKAVASVKL